MTNERQHTSAIQQQAIDTTGSHNIQIKPKDLILPLQRRWFDEIKAGTKTEEYREVTPYWLKRLTGKTFDRLVLTLGYPKRHDTERRIVLPYRGYTVKSIEHAHFEGRKISVFAFKLTE